MRKAVSANGARDEAANCNRFRLLRQRPLLAPSRHSHRPLLRNRKLHARLSNPKPRILFRLTSIAELTLRLSRFPTLLLPPLLKINLKSLNCQRGERS
jgi:hypothetical protein